MTKYFVPKLLSLSLLVSSSAFARTPLSTSADTIVVKQVPHFRKFFIGSAMDAGIFSSATIEHTYYNILGEPIGTNTGYGTLRFSYVINFGITFNYNPSRYFGIFSGVDIKNIGYIEKSDFTGQQIVKRRTYNLGIPLGIKIGNMADKHGYVFLGAGADVPINYRQKTFTNRAQKTKYSEWFSSATPSLMPYVFAGYSIKRGISFKLQYYPNNYLNENYVHNGLTPNMGTTVHLMLFSIGFTAPFSKNPDIVKKQVADLHTATM